MEANSARVKHLLYRAGFGPKADEWPKVRGMAPEKLARKMMEVSEKWKPLSAVEKAPIKLDEMRDMSEDERATYVLSRRLGQARLNFAWINEMAWSPYQVREKLTFFWHDHFACRSFFPQPNEQLNNTLRENALGPFKNLLLAVARDPAMLRFLNNQQNRKDAPNENFARELLELFTLGRGQYTETDVKEAARAFTGWTADLNGEFVFRPRQHDGGSKTFRGKTGNFGGEDIVDLILSDPQCARFLTEKLYRFYVHPEPDPDAVDALSKYYFENQYHTGKLLHRMFTSTAFYAPAHMGARIKSPVEFLVGLMRQFNLSFDGPEGPILVQRALGQVLFQPPNVSGWPDGLAWIDGSSLLARMRLPEILVRQGEWEVRAKEAFAGNEDSFSGERDVPGQKLLCQIDWEPLEAWAKADSRKESLLRLYDFFIQKNQPVLTPEVVMQALEKKGSATLPDIAVALAGSPEYQFC